MKQFAIGRAPLPDSLQPNTRAAAELRERLTPCARVAFFASLPAALVLAAAAVLGAVPALVASSSWLLVLAALTIGLWPVTAAVAAVRTYSVRIARDPAAEPPASLGSGFGQPLSTALIRIDREWRTRHGAAADHVRLLNAMVERLPEPLFLLDNAHSIRFANRSAEEVFGSQLEGRALATVIRAPPLLAAADEVLSGSASAQCEFTADSADDSKIYACELRSLEPVSAARAVLMLRDITAGKRSEHQRADFVANASHEIRTPLTTLLGVIETLQGPARDDDAMRGEFLTMMHDHAARIGRLVDDLLSLSRIESSEHSAPTGTVHLEPVIARAAEALAWQARSRNVRVQIDLHEPLPPVMGDPDELALAFQNLIDNAIKYGNASGAVIVSSAVESETVTMSVRDDGPGIPDEYLPRLTERFFRVDKARSGEFGGTGLGLAIVKHIVRRHRGAFQVHSVLGEGSRFGIRLKRADRAETTPSEHPDT